LSAQSSDTPVQIVHRHVEAMGRRDIDGFLAECAETIALKNAAGQPLLEGQEAIRTMYAGVFAKNPGMKTELIDRINVGNWVIDEHLTTGFADGSQVHVARIYLIADGRIQSIQIFQ
jgi:hypothetical protein